MRNAIGDFFIKLRKKEDESLRDMAEKLNVSAAFLSAIENGKKKISETLINAIYAIYNLDDSESEEFKDAIDLSNNKVEIDLSDVSDSSKKVALKFARKFDSLSDEDLDRLSRLLKLED